MMVDPRGTARIRLVSGRFLILLACLLGACQAPPPPEEGPGPPEPTEPVLDSGAISPARQARAAELFRRAEQEQAAGRPDQAVSLARDVVEEYPASAVSGRALRLLAESSLAAERWELADRAADRYAGLLSPGDPRRVEMRLLQARAMAGSDDHAAQVERLLTIPPDAPRELLSDALEQARDAVRFLSPDRARELLEGTAAGHDLAPVLESWYARLLMADGRTGEAETHARSALDTGARGPDSLLAVAVLEADEARLPDIPGRFVARIGSILPMTGSPSRREVAALIAEGVELAATSVDADGLEVDLASRDDAGDPATAARMVAELEQEGALGVVGFLGDQALQAAARARQGAMPMVSPTARAGPGTGSGVLALAGADPVAASALAEYAASQGYARAAIIHSRVPQSVEEAQAIEGTLQEHGVPVVGSYAYSAGATFFQDQVRAAREALRMEEIRGLGLTEDDTLHVEELDRVALFVPIPAEDVEYVAPQLTFFGLDTLGIDILGTSGWSDPETLETVDQRHTTGVVATSPVRAGPGSSGYARFRQAYEEHFQRSLVSPVPALGYDATRLLLEAVRSGARTPRQMEAALGRIRDLEGATGIFSVVGGRILRRQEVVRIVNGATIPAG